ncbi:putative ubiquinone biosynthesis protein UbiB [Citrobacter koseri]|uniref:Putative ubiquinone biosynthesis protein UbiB n=1 Tax=Citrobacter koseri TaxID=545 RepID=A0A2X2YRA6_CITKO|nr:putative ubiquinone biosynthesis protein UbiB [Citrobacter koseri]
MWIQGGCQPDTNVEEFEFAIRTVCEPIFRKTAGGKSRLVTFY